MLTGDRDSGGIIKDWVKRLRQTGTNRYLFDLPDGVRSSNSTEDFTELSSTDLRMIARALATDIYIYVSSPGHPECHRESYAAGTLAHRLPLFILRSR